MAMPAGIPQSESDSLENSLGGSSREASPLDSSNIKRVRTQYMRADFQEIETKQTFLKKHSCQYELYDDCTTEELKQFNQRHSFMSLLIDKNKNEHGISLLWSESLLRVRGVCDFAKMCDSTILHSAGDIREIVSSIGCVWSILQKLQRESQSEVYREGLTFEFLNKDHLMKCIHEDEMHKIETQIEKLVRFLAHPLHFNFGPLMENGKDYGLDISPDTLLDAFAGVDNKHTQMLRPKLEKAVENLNEMKPNISKILNEANTRELAIYAHKWLRTSQRVTAIARSYIQNTQNFFKKFVTVLAMRHQNDDHEDIARRAVSTLGNFCSFDPHTNNVIWRRNITNLENELKQDKIESLCSLLSTDGIRKLFEACNDEDMQRLFKPSPAMSDPMLESLAEELSGESSRGTELRAEVIVKRIKVVIKHLTAIRDYFNIDNIFTLSPKVGLIVNIERPKAKKDDVILTSKRVYFGGEVKDVGFRLDGKLLVLDKQQDGDKVVSMRVRWDLTGETSREDVLDDMSPAELLNKEDCIINIFTAEGKFVTITLPKQASTEGFLTEIQDEYPCHPPCKPRFFNAESTGTPCQRIALIWDASDNKHSVYETAPDIAQALEFEHKLAIQQQAGYKPDPVPDVVRLFTSKWFREAHLKRSSKLLESEWKELASESKWIEPVLAEKYWLFFLSSTEISRLSSQLAKATLQMKRETADQQSFASKLQELRASALQGNTIIHFELLGDVQATTFEKICQLQGTQLRIIMTQSPATFRLYDSLPKGAVQRVYAPPDFASFANVQSTKFSSNEGFSLARIVASPPQKYSKELLVDSFITFVKGLNDATEVALDPNKTHFRAAEKMTIILLNCPKLTRNEFYEVYKIRDISSDELGYEVPMAIGLDTTKIDSAEQKSYVQKCRNSSKCELVVIWSESTFKSDHIELYSKSLRASSQLLILRSHTKPPISFVEFVSHFPLCQLLNTEACIRLWEFYQRNEETKHLCEGASQQVDKVGDRNEEMCDSAWPLADWSCHWECSYDYSIPETSSIPYIDVIKADLDNYEFGRKECNWAELSLRGFGSSDSLFLSCLATVPHKLRMLCALPESQLNTALQQQAASRSSFSSLLFELVANTLRCPLVQKRLDNISQQGTIAIGLLKWNLWRPDFEFSSKELYEVLNLRQVSLCVPPSADDTLKTYLLVLDEPTGPLFHSCFEQQKWLREWILSEGESEEDNFAMWAQMNNDKIGSAIQRLLLRVSDCSHCWNKTERWGSFVPNVAKERSYYSMSYNWLNYISVAAKAVVLSAIDSTSLTDESSGTPLISEAIQEVIRICPTECVSIINELINNNSEFSVSNATDFVVAAAKKREDIGSGIMFETEDIINADLRHICELVSATDTDTTRTALQRALGDWSRSEFPFHKQPIVWEKFELVVMHYNATHTRDVELSTTRVVNFIRSIFPARGDGVLNANERALCRKVATSLENSNNNDSLLLFAGIWYLCPESSVPLNISPTEMCKALLTLKRSKDVGWGTFTNFVKENMGLMPQFALALCGYHEYLDDLTYNHFRKLCFPEWSELQSKTILVATEDAANGMTAHTAVVSRRIISSESLVKIGVIPSTFSLGPYEKELSKVRFDLTSGVSRNSVQLNIQALTNGRCHSGTAKSNKWNPPSGEQLATDQYYMRALIIAWFQSFGIFPDEIYRFLSNPTDQEKIKKAVSEVKNCKERDTNTGIWAIAFPPILNSALHLKSSALRLCGADSASHMYTQISMRECYEACGQNSTKHDVVLESKTEEYRTGFTTGLRFTTNYTKGVDVKTPLNLYIPPLSRIASFCRQLQRTKPDSLELKDVLLGFVKKVVLKETVVNRMQTYQTRFQIFVQHLLYLLSY